MNFSFLLVSAAQIWGKAWPILIAVLFFGFIVFGHELGHFTFARIFKVKINEFALGMGPILFKKKRGETQYDLRLFPIGGFVSMEGEDEESSDENAYGKKKVWKRFIIVAAGAVVNLLIGTAILAVILCQQNLIGTPQIHSFAQNAVSAESGLEKMDKIKKINGKRVFSEYDISYLLMRDSDGVVNMTVMREGELLDIKDVSFNATDANGQNKLVFDIVLVGVDQNPWTVLKYSVLESVSVARIVWISLFDIVTGQYKVTDLSGPIGTVSYIADAAVQSSKTDLTPLLTIMAFISINIGVFNLLPIPALDGGKLFFMLIEMVFRKPVPAKYENWVHAVGFILLMLFIAAISLSDIVKLIRG